MHSSSGMACCVWNDKRPILLLSTHAISIQPPCIHPKYIVNVPHWNGAIQESIQTSPIHLEYTTHMRGVDMADQLRASYICQTRSHKWWHQVFFFLLDTTIVNIYILYLAHLHHQRIPRSPMTHLEFKLQLCDALLQQNWGGTGAEQEFEG